MITRITAFNTITATAFGGTNFNAAAAAWPASPNGSTGPVNFPANNGRGMFVKFKVTDPGLLSDNITDVRMEYDWVVTGPTFRCTKYVTDALGGVPMPGGQVQNDGDSNGTMSASYMPDIFAGPIDRATLFAKVFAWQFVAGCLSGAPADVTLTISNMVIIVTDDTPVDPAVVDEVVPATGTWEGGDAVTLYGSGFTGRTKARFGAAEATDFVVVNDGEATCTTPPHGTGRGRVEVTVE